MTMITSIIRTNVSGAAAVYNAGMAQPKSADQVEVSYFFLMTPAICNSKAFKHFLNSPVSYCSTEDNVNQNNLSSVDLMNL